MDLNAIQSIMLEFMDLNAIYFLLTAGVKKCARGGAFGFGLASLYCAYTSRDRLKDWLGL